MAKRNRKRVWLTSEYSCFGAGIYSCYVVGHGVDEGMLVIGEDGSCLCLNLKECKKFIPMVQEFIEKQEAHDAKTKE